MKREVWGRLFRIVFASVLLSLGGAAGYYIGMTFLSLPKIQALEFSKRQMVSTIGGFVGLGAMLGFVLGSIAYRRLLQIGKGLLSIPAPDRVAGVFGILLGLIFAYLVAFPLFRLIPAVKPYLSIPLFFLLAAVFCYIGVVLGMSLKQELYNFLSGGRREAEEGKRREEPPKVKPKLLDTNVIIDGRIAEIAKTGFLEGELLVPQFVLEELRTIADSADPLKRVRGRRGLEMLNRMREDPRVKIRVYDSYSPDLDRRGQEVDTKLIKLAKELDAVLVTNDYHLYQMAAFQDVKVLNINELAQAVRPIVLPGETLTIALVREGSEPGQGVGYLEDGTMVVVEKGRDYIGKQVEVVVTGLYQTVAGKMIFAELKKEAKEARAARDARVGHHSGGGEGKKAR